MVFNCRENYDVNFPPTPMYKVMSPWPRTFE